MDVDALRSCLAQHHTTYIASSNYTVDSTSFKQFYPYFYELSSTAFDKLLPTWLDRLTPTGTAHLVVQKHLGSDSLQRWLAGQGWATTRLAARAAYRILAVTARTDPTP